MDIDKIISGYLSDELSEKEKKELDGWLKEDSSHHEQLDTMANIWKTKLGYPEVINIDDEQKKVWKRISGQNLRSQEDETHGVFKFGILLRYAAIFAFALAVGYVLWINTNQQPSGNVAPQVIERVNPLGQKSKIQLPDGTIVWLNAGSKLTYLSDFNSDSRKVNLEGEAFFEVTKNEQIPFEVFTNDLVITAIGTSFNVNAFLDKETESVALLTGKVKVGCLDANNKSCNTSYMVPGDMVFFNNRTGEIKQTEFSGTDPFGWKDGRIVFSHATFNEVLEKLTRWYNVEITVTGSLDQEWNYTTTFDNENLENILESLKFSEKIDYEMEGTIVKIKL